MERDEAGQIAEGKVRIAVAELRAEILPQLSEIKERIIGIDGNGTGRPGAIQIIDRKVDNINGKVDLLLTKGAEAKGALNQRQAFIATFWSALGIIACVGSVILAEYVKHRMGW